MSNQTQWREWDLQGLLVTQLRFHHSTHIHAWSQERDLLLVFGTSFTFRSDEGGVLRLDPEQSASLCPLLSLLFRPLSSFQASSEGQCRLMFADGTELSCAPDEQYEAWESHGTGALAGASLLCGPGGGSPWGGTP